MKEYLIYLLCSWIHSPSLKRKVKSRLCTQDKGNENQVELCSNFYGKVRVYGNNNKIVIQETNRRFKLRILVSGDNNTIIIGKDVLISGISLSIGAKQSKVNNVRCLIDDRSAFGDKNYFYLFENDCSLQIGKNCMFSNYITVRCGEKPHALVDRESGKIITGKYDVSIGDHCWIGTNCYIMKNAGLANNTTVGSCSVVTKKFDIEYCVIAGNPARIVKENIDWVQDYRQCL